MNLEIIGVARNPEKVDRMCFPANILWLYQDMSQELKITKKVDYIFHTACPTQSQYLSQKPVEVITDTVQGAQNVFSFAREMRAAVVYLSSIEVYGKMDMEDMVDENAYGYINHLNSRSSYPESKKLIECLAAGYAAEYGADIKIARLTQTLGAGIDKADNRVFAQFAKAAIHSKDIVLHTEGKSAKSYVYTMDVIHALFYILLKGKKGEAYNVANEESFISIYELAQFVIEKFNPNIKVRVEKKEMGYAPETKVNLDTEKLRALGWACHFGLFQMFERLIRYMKEIDV